MWRKIKEIFAKIDKALNDPVIYWLSMPIWLPLAALATVGLLVVGSIIAELSYSVFLILLLVGGPIIALIWLWENISFWVGEWFEQREIKKRNEYFEKQSRGGN